MTHVVIPGEGRNQQSIKQLCQSVEVSGSPCGWWEAEAPADLLIE